MWEPALCAGFQAPGITIGNFRFGYRNGSPARHFHSEAEDSAHFRQKQPWNIAHDWKSRFSENSVDRALLQILVQSPLFICILQWNTG
jgi:hypothetical protein